MIYRPVDAFGEEPAPLSEPESRARAQCADCRALSPENRSEYTLISSRYGWRLARVVRAGKQTLEWRCPTCWAVYKSRQNPARDGR